MTEHDDPADDRLRARLRAADPASSLAPADQRRVTRLLEAAMSENDERRRPPLSLLAGAAAVLVVAGVTLATVLGGDDAPTPAAGEADGQGSAVLSLEAPAAAPGRCMVPTAPLLAAQEVAFLGTVEEVADGTVELEVDEAYAGVEAATVEVAAPDPDLPALVGALDFREGEQYLVSAREGRMTVCGFSGPATPRLQALYDEAFPG